MSKYNEELDDLPFCTISGCEALSIDCHKTCPRSVQHRYFIKQLADLDYKLKAGLNPLVLQEVRQIIGNGLGKLVVLTPELCKSLMIDRQQIVIDRHLEPFTLYDLYDDKGECYGKIYVLDSYYSNKGWNTEITHVENI